MIIAGGALQCFAPARLKSLQDKLRPQHVDWTASAGGAFFERLREKEARQPSPGYRFGSLVVVALGIHMLLASLGFFRHLG